MTARRAGLVPAGPEVEGLRFSVLSDLSANVFAALLLILILLLQIRVAADRTAAPPVPPPPLDAAVDLGAVAHRPLGARDLVALLRARGGGAPGLSLDLGTRGLGVSEADGTAERWSSGDALLPALAAALRDGGPGLVRLYVFSNRDFAAVTAALASAGRPFTDLSVPRALRDRATGGAWSPAFLALAGAPGTDAAFRDGLARLLAQDSGPLAPEGRVAGGGASGVPDGAASPAGGASGLPHVFASALAVAALVLGCGLVVVIEIRGRASPHIMTGD